MQLILVQSPCPDDFSGIEESPKDNLVAVDMSIQDLYCRGIFRRRLHCACDLARLYLQVQNGLQIQPDLPSQNRRSDPSAIKP